MSITKTTIDKDIFVLHNVLSVDECKELIDFSEKQGYHEATVFTGREHKMVKGIRNNLRVLSDDQVLADKIWKRVKPYFKSKIQGFKAYGLNERFRYYKYEVGQRFKRHKDGAFERTLNDRSIYTFIIYLNEDFEGGETKFSDSISVQPEIGSALCFLHPILHEGTMVTEGIKYAIRSDVMYKK